MDPKFEVDDHLRILYQKIPFLQKVTLQIGLKKFFWLKRLKILCHEHMLYVISDHNGQEIGGTFYGKVLQKTNQK